MDEPVIACPFNVVVKRAVTAVACPAVIACALAVSGAQTPKPAVESPLIRQLHQAINLADKGDKKQAMELTDALVAQHPDFGPALKLKAMLLEDGGNEYEAGEAYQKALKFSPNDPDLLFKVGVYQLVAGDKARAIELLTHHLRLAPRDADAYYYLSQAYHLTGHDDQALKAIKECVQIQPGNAAVVQKYGELLSSSGNYQEGLPWLLKAQKADPTLAHIDYEIGLADFKLMDVDGAAVSLAKDVQAHPDDVAGLNLLAEAQLKLTHWPQAKDAFTRLANLKPGDSNVLLGLGHAELEMQDYAASVQTLNEALRADPTQLLAHFYLARAYAGLGDTEKAQHQAALHRLMMDQQSFVRALENDKQEGAIRQQARQMLSESREADALNLYRDRFKGTAATDADAYVFLGKLYLFMGKTEDGLRCLDHAMAMNPAVRGAHTYKGILALKLSEFDKAEGEFKAELATDPNYQTAIAEIGEIRYRESRWQEAADYLAKSKTKTPELLYMLCDSYFHLGMTTEADLNAEAAAAYGRNRPDFMSDLLDLLKRNSQTDLAAQLAAEMKQ